MGRILDRLNKAGELRRWTARADSAESLDDATLRQMRAEARQLRRQLDRLLHVAEGRIALPRAGSTAFPRPHDTDWAWRPELWRGPLPRPGIVAAPSKSRLGDEATLFHDCAQSELTLRQMRNRRDDDLAPFGLRMDVYRFDGTFLSLVIDLPVEATTGLTRNHLLRVATVIDVEKPLEIFARLNVKHGPNTEQLVREFSLETRETMVEFDMAYSGLDENRVERAWLDLIFEAPEMNQVMLRDLNMARYRRAAL
ncbi:MAG: DUF6478 family protein [Pseudomonadota bacterium]|nr:DUF6478 family protein [Pseudomonadota bacterium]